MRRHAKAIVAISALLSTFVLGASSVSAAAPVVEMGTVSDASYASAHVTGKVDPADTSTYWSFEYSTDGVNWSGFRFEGPIGANAGSTDVEADLAGLKGSTEYEVRLVALNFVDPEVVSAGPNPTFTTLPVDPPAVLTANDATDVSFIKAKVSGSVERPVNPDPAFDVNCRFEYVTQDQFSADGFASASSTPCDVNPVTTPGTSAVQAELTGLQHSTTYHVRLTAENPGGSDSLEASNTFTTLAASAPSVTLDPVVDPGSTSANLTSEVNPNGTPTTAYFEYSDDGGVTWIPFPGHFESVYSACPTPTSCPIPDPVALGEGSSPVDFDRLLPGLLPLSLEPNTNYQVRLRATNAGGETVTPPQSFKTDPVAPETQTLWAGSIGTDSAALAARVNPHNSAVTYRFEWGTDTSYGSFVPASAQSLGAVDNEFHVITAPLTGLTPDTTYHYRVVATNTETSQVSEGIDRAFTTPGSAPDFPVRGLEKISPDEKNNFGVGGRGAKAITADGNRVVFTFEGNGPGAEQGGSAGTPYFASRGASGWASQPIDAPYPAATCGLNRPFYWSFNAELTEAIYRSAFGLTPGSDSGEPNLYRRQIPSGESEQLNPRPHCSGDSQADQLDTFSVSADYDSVLIQAQGPEGLTDDAVDGHPNAYLSRDGVTRLVGILPDGTVPPTGTKPAGSLTGGSLSNAVSDDGNRAVFQVIDPELSQERAPLQGQGQLYVRTDNRIDPPSTVHVSASQRTPSDPAGPLPAKYWNAEAEHGSKVLFSSCEKLTDDSTAEVGRGECADPYNVPLGAAPGSELYLFDSESGELKDLTTSPSGGGRLLGVVGASRSLDHIYFVAEGDLAAGAIAGQPNLYHWSQDTTELIATLERSCVVTSDPDSPLFRPIDCDNWAASSFARVRNSRVSADGQSMLFVSRARVTAYNNANLDKCGVRESFPDVLLTDGCAEAYLYEADTKRLSCLSCPSGGGQATGDAALNSDRAAVQGPDEAPGNIADSSIFFETPQSLVAADVDGRRDVYEWKDGHIALTSPGSVDAESSFIDATPDGSTALIRTRDQLVGSDRDSITDVYAVRVGGGFPEPPIPLPCQGEACRGPASFAPPESTPASPTFSGPGNPKAKHKKQKKQRKGRKGNKKQGKKAQQKRAGAKRGGGK